MSFTTHGPLASVAVGNPRLPNLNARWLIILGVFIAGCSRNTDPEAARIVMSDLSNFWAAFDEAGPSLDPEPFDRLYLQNGSEGLKGFIDYRIKDAENLAGVIQSRSRYYASMREPLERIPEMESAIRESFRELKRIYPDAVFPDTYFVVGAMNSGGTTSRNGLIIGADMYGLSPATPMEELDDWLRSVLKPVEGIPHIVAHELIHFQQPFSFRSSLLYRSIREGSADFMAELISGRHINEHVHEYANPREADLWAEFKTIMRQDDMAGWIAGGIQNDRPADLGYWMGYKITASYYGCAADKNQAVHDILNMTNPQRFLEDSGYETGCPAE